MLEGNVTQIKDLVKYKPLSRYKGLTGSLPIVGGFTYIGLEVELENIPRYVGHNVSSSTWNVTEDGSLKLQGKEFVTIPIKFSYLETEIRRLFSGLKSPSASSRCSVHVHINVREMTLDELSAFIILYLIFERSLYRFSGDRWNSNFCVPLYSAPKYPTEVLTSIATGRWLQKPLVDYVHWFKYLGLNLCPIVGIDGSGAQGTVEFRHLKGTTDVNLIINWINLIISLKLASKKYDLDTLKGLLFQMNSDSSYTGLTDSVFGKYANFILDQPTFKKDIEDCISVAKKIVFNHKKKEQNMYIPLSGVKLCAD